MAIIKCKMCGGDLLLTEGATTAECEYCGSLQTVPTADNEKKLTLFARANRLRAACEFDKAAGIYENIVSDFPEEAEAYWGLVLCKYGIEYVDDPGTGKKIPTCHRSSFDSVMDDENFEQACENADMVAKKVYRDEAKHIEEIRRGILEVSASEKPYDVFICYKETDAHGDRTVDSLIAQDIYDALTSKGYRTFFSRITLEDKLGQAYEPYIFAALNSAKVMLAVGTCYEHYDAVWVKNEWSRYLKIAAKDKNRYLIPCYKGIDAYDIPKEFAHLQGQDMGKVGAIADLIRGVEKLIPKAAPTAKETVIVQSGGSHGEALVKRGFLALEDEDWDKADRFFEEALNQNAESGGAYWGKLLAAEHARNAYALVDKYANAETTAEINPEAVSIINDDHKAKILKSLQTHIITNYLPKAAATACFHSDRNWKYTSYKTGFAERLTAIKLYFNENKLCQRAVHYADLTLQEEINQTLSAIYTAWQQRVQDAENRDNTAKQAMLAEYEAHLEQAEIKINQFYAEACEERESDYTQACQLQESAIRAKDYGQVIELYEKIGDFKDAIRRKEECLPIYEELKAKEERRRARREAEIKRQKRAKRIRIAIICGVTAVLAAAGILVYTNIIIPTEKYNNAQALAAAGDNAHAAMAFNKLGIFKDAQERSAALWNELAIRNTVSAGPDYTVGLKSDGTVVAAGENDYGNYNVSNWQDIIAISAGLAHTIGLKADGTVVATGVNGSGQCDVLDWQDIVAVCAGWEHTVGLKADGTVVAAGNNDYDECDVSDWQDIVAISVGWEYTVGLKADGSVVTTGFGSSNQCANWQNIISISAGAEHTVGLKADGTVVATGSDSYGQCRVSDWQDIVAVSTGPHYTVGLKSNGTIVAVGEIVLDQFTISDWRDIVAVSAGWEHIVGLKSDGTVIASGENDYGQCDVERWGDIKLP